MVDAVSISLSALKTAAEKIRGGAENIANMETLGTPAADGTVTGGYIPQDVIAVSDPVGGVQSRTVDRDPAHVLAYDPNNPQANENGMVAVPNVDLATEAVTIKQAEIAYRASLNVIKVAGSMQDDLLKIFDEKV